MEINIFFPTIFLLSGLIISVILLTKKIKILKMQKIESKNLKSQIQEYNYKLDSLITSLLSIYNIQHQDTYGGSKEVIYQSIVDYACFVLGVNISSFMLYDNDTQTLKIVASRGISPEIVETAKVKLGEGIAGKIAKTGQPILVEDIYKISDLDINPRYSGKSKGFISIPIQTERNLFGVLNISSDDKNKSFTNYDLKLIQILANASATFLENIKLNQELSKFYFDLIQTLSKTVDIKDKYTHRHSERARTYARALALELKLPEEIVKYVEYAAVMHDIGKIGIDDTILLKKGELTQEEYEKIKKHPEIGTKIISNVNFLAPIVPMILYHQEWYNGDGYPEGLKEKVIPIGARIVAIIDAWDAMTSDRPYRKALSIEKAISELIKNRGTQFDPEIVDCFLNVLRKDNYPVDKIINSLNV